MTTSDDCAPGRPVWWAISGEAIQDALRRAHAGEDPDVIYLQLCLESVEHDDESDE